MAPFLRAFFLAAFFLSMSTAPAFATQPSVSEPEKKDFSPVEWPLTNYPCKKLPAEETACLIDEMLRHIKAGELETPWDKNLFDQIVYSIARWGTTRQKEFILNSLIDVPQHLVRNTPQNKVRRSIPVPAEDTQQYQKMILLLSLGKIDAAVDFLKHAAKTTFMPQYNNSSLQERGIDFLLQTQTVDSAYDFAKKTADIFYIIPKGRSQPSAGPQHPLLNLLHQQIRTHGFTSHLKVTKLFQGNNVYNWLSPNFNIDKTIAHHAQKSKGSKAYAYYDKFCKDQGDLAVLHLKEIQQGSPAANNANTHKFIEIKINLDSLGCFKIHPEILLSLAEIIDKENPTADNVPAEKWHDLTIAQEPQEKIVHTPQHTRYYQTQLKALRQKAQIYKEIKDTYTTAAPAPEKTPKDALFRAYGQPEDIPEEMVHISYFWAALHCPPAKQNLCIQKTSEEYRAHHLETIENAAHKDPFTLGSVTNITIIKYIQDFIARFKSTLRLNDFIDPKILFTDTNPLSRGSESMMMQQIEASSPPEVAALYVLEAKASAEKRPPPPVDKHKNALIEVFLTTPPEQISDKLAALYENISYYSYMQSVLPALDAARFDIVKDKFWQVYTHACMNRAASIVHTLNRPALEYAYCINHALSQTAIADNEKRQPFPPYAP